MMKKSILVIVLIALGATGFFLAKEPTPQPSAVKTEATAAASQNANCLLYTSPSPRDTR